MTQPVDGPGGRVEVNLAETPKDLALLEQVCDTLANDWNARREGCRPANLGKGPMGKAFQKAIDAATAATANDGPVDSIPAFYRKSVANATDALKYYQGGEAAALGDLTDPHR